MQARNPIWAPVLGTLGGGLALGMGLFLATPTTPLAPPEPAWRKAGGSPEIYFSGETYAAGSAGYPASQSYADHEAMAPQLVAVTSYIRPEATRYDEPPQYTEDRRDEYRDTYPGTGSEPEPAAAAEPAAVAEPADLAVSEPEPGARHAEAAAAVLEARAALEPAGN